MDDTSYHVRVPKRWVRIALIVTVTALVVAPLTAVATHSFTDVPNDNTFHADIEWLKDADVTRGCNPPDNTRFCPKDNVTREQMSAFMRRLAENQVVDAGSLGGLDASAFYTAEEVDAKLSTPTHVGIHNGVGNNAGCGSGEVSVVINDANGDPTDGRFTFQVPGANPAFGQIRAGGSIRNASANVANVIHEQGTGVYCIQFNVAIGQPQRESTVVSLHADGRLTGGLTATGAAPPPGELPND